MARTCTLAAYLYHAPVFCTSPYSAGGVAIYVSDELIFHERSDIQFNAPDCESCFVEIECNGSQNNPVFGAMYIGMVLLIPIYLMFTWGSFLRSSLIRVYGLHCLEILI